MRAGKILQHLKRKIFRRPTAVEWVLIVAVIAMIVVKWSSHSRVEDPRLKYLPGMLDQYDTPYDKFKKNEKNP